MKEELRMHSPRVRDCIRYLTVIILIISLMPLSACEGIEPNEKQTTIYIATDLHLFSNNLTSEGNQNYTKDRFTSDGRVQEYDYGLIRALVDEVNANKPDFLVLTGDLSFNGERDSHLELARLLGGIGKDTKVLVIPGNHDMYSPEAVSVINDTMEPTDSITVDDFRQIYSDFGYSGGLYYDESTLSYIFELGEDTWGLMLDTTMSRYNEEYGYSITGGGLEESTLTWLEEKLTYAKEKGISIISFTHHNLLVHNELFESSYTLRNSDEITELYAKYGVKLNFSGHLHIQSIKQKACDDGEVYDISGGSLLDYGNRYGRLEIYDNCYSYESVPLDLSAIGEDARGHSFDTFCTEYYYKTLWMYKIKLGERRAEKAIGVLSEINAHYFDGNYEQIHRLIRKNGRFIRLIKKKTVNYDTSYVKTILEVPKENQHSLLIER